ncbi:MAG: phosphatidate cytidylyltransferase [Sphingomonadales bacterium]|nr:phosphatidate cytidylyltransferase [Sphingomonadales bacterium]
MAGADSAKKSDLGVRMLSAMVMLAVAGGALWLGGWFWTGFVTLVALGVAWEWRSLVVGFVHSPIVRGLWNFAGLIYIGVAAAALTWLRAAQDGRIDAVLVPVGAVIATDIGAYFMGRAIGGPKIAPAISPSKTWAGLVGGIVGASVVILATTYHQYEIDLGMQQRISGSEYAPPIAPLPIPAFHWPTAVVLSACIAIVAQAGDFFESWMKRRAGVKDSGRLLPGHGGLFDRVDGLLAVMFVGAVVSLPALVASLS